MSLGIFSYHWFVLIWKINHNNRTLQFKFIWGQKWLWFTIIVTRFKSCILSYWWAYWFLLKLRLSYGYDKLFVISSPFSINQIITNFGFSRLADNFTFQLCWLPYPNVGLAYEYQLRKAIGWFTPPLIISYILRFAKSLEVTWGIFQVIFVISSLKVLFISDLFKHIAKILS